MWYSVTVSNGTKSSERTFPQVSTEELNGFLEQLQSAGLQIIRVELV